jgi:hypothetical protein
MMDKTQAARAVARSLAEGEMLYTDQGEEMVDLAEVDEDGAIVLTLESGQTVKLVVVEPVS